MIIAVTASGCDSVESLFVIDANLVDQHWLQFTTSGLSNSSKVRAFEKFDHNHMIYEKHMEAINEKSFF